MKELLKKVYDKIYNDNITRILWDNTTVCVTSNYSYNSIDIESVMDEFLEHDFLPTPIFQLIVGDKKALYRIFIITTTEEKSISIYLAYHDTMNTLIDYQYLIEDDVYVEEYKEDYKKDVYEPIMKDIIEFIIQNMKE